MRFVIVLSVAFLAACDGPYQSTQGELRGLYRGCKTETMRTKREDTPTMKRLVIECVPQPPASKD